jgi:hypothetical protein
LTVGNGDVKLDPAFDDFVAEEGVAANAVHVVQYVCGHD